MARALIGLGSNLGDRAGNLQAAIDRLHHLPGICLIAVSRFHNTAAVGGPIDQPDYLNAVATLETAEQITARECFAALQGIERELGREWTDRWGARTIDLDLLLWDDLILNDSSLTIPHPRMSFRPFVLKPTLEVAPDWLHPTTGWSVYRLWENLQITAKRVLLLVDDRPQSQVEHWNNLLHDGDLKIATTSDRSWPAQLFCLIIALGDAVEGKPLVTSDFIGLGRFQSPRQELNKLMNSPCLALCGCSEEQIVAEVKAALQAIRQVSTAEKP